MKSSEKAVKRQSRHARIRAKVIGTAERPRLSVYKSNRAVSAQLIDDSKGYTLAAATTRTLSGASMTEKAGNVGREIAKAAKKAGVAKVVFDRGGFIYTGLIKAVAEGARAEGLSL